jgi:hypothetical protein
MAGKKTGLYLSPIAEEIVNEVAQKFGYTKVSNTVNYIILEYSKLVKQPKQETQLPEPVEEKVAKNLSDWFVSEDKPS